MHSPGATGWAFLLVTHRKTKEQDQGGGLASSCGFGSWQVLHDSLTTWGPNPQARERHGKP